MNLSQLEACRNVLERLRDKCWEQDNQWFLHPVNGNELKDYSSIISKPMDLSTVKTNLLKKRMYQTTNEFLADVKLIFQNAKEYNRNRYRQVYDSACFMSKQLDRIVSASQGALGLAGPSSAAKGSRGGKGKGKRESGGGGSGKGVSARNDPGSAGRSSKGALQGTARQRCVKLVEILKKQPGVMNVFYHPVDTKEFVDYKDKIPNPMSLSQVEKKLKGNKYARAEDCVRDLRRICSNALRYNHYLEGPIRKNAVHLMALILDEVKDFSPAFIVPEWEQCVKVLDGLLAVPSSEPGVQEAHIFLWPIEIFYPTGLPSGYAQRVKKRSDIASLTTRLLEGELETVEQFAEEGRRMFVNCITFWKGKPEQAHLVRIAENMLRVFERKCKKYLSTKASAVACGQKVPSPPRMTTPSGSGEGVKSAKSSGGGSSGGRRKFKKPVTAPQSTCMKLLKALRNHKTHARDGSTIQTAGPFLHAVDVTLFPDYLDIVRKPMDLKLVEKNVKHGRYPTMQEFHDDIMLIFKNALDYNTGEKGMEVCYLTKSLMSYFEKEYEKETTHLKKDKTPTTNPPSSRPSGSRKSSGSKKGSQRSSRPTPVENPEDKVDRDDLAAMYGEAAAAVTERRPQPSDQGGHNFFTGNDQDIDSDDTPLKIRQRPSSRSNSIFINSDSSEDEMPPTTLFSAREGKGTSKNTDNTVKGSSGALSPPVPAKPSAPQKTPTVMKSQSESQRPKTKFKLKLKTKPRSLQQPSIDKNKEHTRKKEEPAQPLPKVEETPASQDRAHKTALNEGRVKEEAPTPSPQTKTSAPPSRKDVKENPVKQQQQPKPADEMKPGDDHQQLKHALKADPPTAPTKADPLSQQPKIHVELPSNSRTNDDGEKNGQVPKSVLEDSQCAKVPSNSRLDGDGEKHGQIPKSVVEDSQRAKVPSNSRLDGDGEKHGQIPKSVGEDSERAKVPSNSRLDCDGEKHGQIPKSVVEDSKRTKVGKVDPAPPGNESPVSVRSHHSSSSASLKRERDRDKDRHRPRDKDRDRQRERERGHNRPSNTRNRSKSRSRERGRHRDRGGDGRDRDGKHRGGRSRERDRDKDKDRGSDRRGRDQIRDKDRHWRDRSKSERDRERERDRDRGDRDKDRGERGDRDREKARAERGDRERSERDRDKGRGDRGDRDRDKDRGERGDRDRDKDRGRSRDRNDGRSRDRKRSRDRPRDQDRDRDRRDRGRDRERDKDRQRERTKDRGSERDGRKDRSKRPPKLERERSGEGDRKEFKDAERRRERQEAVKKPEPTDTSGEVASVKVEAQDGSTTPLERQHSNLKPSLPSDVEVEPSFCKSPAHITPELSGRVKEEPGEEPSPAIKLKATEIPKENEKETNRQDQVNLDTSADVVLKAAHGDSHETIAEIVSSPKKEKLAPKAPNLSVPGAEDKPEPAIIPDVVPDQAVKREPQETQELNDPSKKPPDPTMIEPVKIFPMDKELHKLPEPVNVPNPRKEQKTSEAMKPPVSTKKDQKPAEAVKAAAPKKTVKLKLVLKKNPSTSRHSPSPIEPPVEPPLKASEVQVKKETTETKKPSTSVKTEQTFSRVAVEPVDNSVVRQENKAETKETKKLSDAQKIILKSSPHPTESQKSVAMTTPRPPESQKPIPKNSSRPSEADKTLESQRPIVKTTSRPKLKLKIGKKGRLQAPQPKEPSSSKAISRAPTPDRAQESAVPPAPAVPLPEQAREKPPPRQIKAESPTIHKADSETDLERLRRTVTEEMKEKDIDWANLTVKDFINRLKTKHPGCDFKKHKAMIRNLLVEEHERKNAVKQEPSSESSPSPPQEEQVRVPAARKKNEVLGSHPRVPLHRMPSLESGEIRDDVPSIAPGGGTSDDDSPLEYEDVDHKYERSEPVKKKPTLKFKLKLPQQQNKTAPKATKRNASSFSDFEDETAPPAKKATFRPRSNSSIPASPALDYSSNVSQQTTPQCSDDETSLSDLKAVKQPKITFKGLSTAGNKGKGPVNRAPPRPTTKKKKKTSAMRQVTRAATFDKSRLQVVQQNRQPGTASGKPVKITFKGKEYTPLMSSDSITAGPGANASNKVKVRPPREPSPSFASSPAQSMGHSKKGKGKGKFVGKKSFKKGTWQEKAMNIVQNILKHEWVDGKTFWMPVEVAFPDIWEHYKTVIAQPMDLGKVRGMLEDDQIQSPQQFVDTIMLVFDNAMQFNRENQELGIREMLKHAEHLKKVTMWLCLERLPLNEEGEGVVDDANRLTCSRQQEERRYREEKISSEKLRIPALCRKIIKSMKQQTHWARMQWFVEPPDRGVLPGYGDVVSKPMDFRTCGQLLENGHYTTYGQFFADARLIFENAKRYNGPRQESDPGSKQAFLDAQFMAGVLEKAINETTIEIADRVGREDTREWLGLERAAAWRKDKIIGGDNNNAEPRRAVAVVPSIRERPMEDMFEESQRWSPRHQMEIEERMEKQLKEKRAKQRKTEEGRIKKRLREEQAQRRRVALREVWKMLEDFKDNSSQPPDDSRTPLPPKPTIDQRLLPEMRPTKLSFSIPKKSPSAFKFPRPGKRKRLLSNVCTAFASQTDEDGSASTAPNMNPNPTMNLPQLPKVSTNNDQIKDDITMSDSNAYRIHGDDGLIQCNYDELQMLYAPQVELVSKHFFASVEKDSIATAPDMRDVFGAYYAPGLVSTTVLVENSLKGNVTVTETTDELQICLVNINFKIRSRLSSDENDRFEQLQARAFRLQDKVMGDGQELLNHPCPKALTEVFQSCKSLIDANLVYSKSGGVYYTQPKAQADRENILMFAVFSIFEQTSIFIETTST